MRRVAGSVLAMIVLLPPVGRAVTRPARSPARSAQSECPPPAAPAPQASPPPCTVDADCRHPGARGRCFTTAIAAQYTQAFCDCEDGRAWRAAHPPNTCVFDECDADAPPGEDRCATGTRCDTLEMAPFPQHVCVPAACTSDLQCRRAAGGRCASYFNAGRCRRGGWACSYPRDACAPRDPHRMCPVVRGMLPYCAPRGGRFECVQDPVVPTAPAAASVPVP